MLTIAFHFLSISFLFPFIIDTSVIHTYVFDELFEFALQQPMVVCVDQNSADNGMRGIRCVLIYELTVACGSDRSPQIFFSVLLIGQVS